MPLYEYYCEECQKTVTVLQSADVNKEETTCPDCGSANVRHQFSTFSSNIFTPKPASKPPVTADELPKGIFNLPTPRLASDYHTPKPPKEE